MSPAVSPETRKSLYDLVGNNHLNFVIDLCLQHHISKSCYNSARMWMILTHNLCFKLYQHIIHSLSFIPFFPVSSLTNLPKWYFIRYFPEDQKRLADVTPSWAGPECAPWWTIVNNTIYTSVAFLMHIWTEKENPHQNVPCMSPFVNGFTVQSENRICEPS